MGALEEYQKKILKESKEKEELLNAKIVDFEKMVNGFEKSLRDFKPTVKTSYKLSDAVAINQLKEALNRVDIPKEIAIQKNTNITYDSKSSKALLNYSIIVTCIMLLFLGVIFLLIKDDVLNLA